MMKNKIRYTMIVLGILTVFVGVPPSVSAVDSAGKSDACAALKEIDPAKACGTGDNGINNIVNKLITTLSVVVGIVAVFMIILSGFKYITSSGESGSISNAKTTLIYALIGLAVAVLAQVLVRFVFQTIDACQYNSSISTTDGKCVPPKP